MSTIGNLFDGDLSTNFALNTTNDKTARLTFSPAITGNLIEVYVNQAGTAFNKNANGTTNLTADGWNTVNGNSLFYLEGMTTAGSGYFDLRAIRVDNRLLINGPADNSQTWGEYISSDNGSSK